MAIITKDAKVGEVFTGKPKVVSWERLWAFSGGQFRLEGWPSRNIHTDPEYAKTTALPSVAASATQFMGYVVELMIDLFGVEWLRHGRMDVKFIELVDAGDTLVSNAEVKSKDPQNGATKFTMEVYCDNQRGRKVLVGSTTGIVGKIDPSWGAEDFKNRLAALKSDSSIQHDVAEPGLEPLEYVVTPELNQQFLYGEEDFHPRYIQETEAGPPIVHPGLILNWSNGTRSPSHHIVPGQWGMHAHDETFFYNPARVGKKIRVTWPGRVGAYEKRGRPWSVSEILVVDEDGVEIIRRLSHSTPTSQQYKKEYNK